MKRESQEKLAKELNIFLGKILPIVKGDTAILYHMINVLIAALVSEKLIDGQTTIGGIIHYLVEQDLIEVEDMSKEEMEELANMDVPPKHELN